jgi:hypothetical protein
MASNTSSSSDETEKSLDSHNSVGFASSLAAVVDSQSEKGSISSNSASDDNWLSKVPAEKASGLRNLHHEKERQQSLLGQIFLDALPDKGKRIKNSIRTVKEKLSSARKLYSSKPAAANTTSLQHWSPLNNKILGNPSNYIGSVEHVMKPMWVYSRTASSWTQNKISYIPGLYKIFDGILTNAAKNKIKDPSMDTIKVDIDA